MTRRGVALAAIIPALRADLHVGSPGNGRRRLYVSTGIGTSILPVRFLVPPEINLLVIERAASRCAALGRRRMLNRRGKEDPMLKRYLVALSTAVLLAGTVAHAAPPVTAAAAFERLASLSGAWDGTVEGEGGAVRITYRTISGGRAVLETLFPGTEHEMLSIYLLDGDELRMTHDCAMGNQPRMRLDRRTSTPTELRFVFEGGSNLDPAKDGHIHDGRITLGPDGTITAAWTYNRDGKPAGQHVMTLGRAPAATTGSAVGR